MPEVLPEDEPPIPVEPEPRPEPELLPVLGLLGLVVLPELEPPMLPELEPVLPVELEPVLPEPEVLPYCFTQSSRCVPVRPTHWLGRLALPDDEPPIAPEPDAPEPEVELSELPELELPELPEPLEPEPALGLVVELDPEPALGLVVELLPLPVTLGLLVELPVLPLELPVDCAHEALATPTRAAATAALRVFNITMYAPLVEIERLRPLACKRDAATKETSCGNVSCRRSVKLLVDQETVSEFRRFFDSNRLGCEGG